MRRKVCFAAWAEQFCQYKITGQRGKGRDGKNTSFPLLADLVGLVYWHNVFL